MGPFRLHDSFPKSFSLEEGMCRILFFLLFLVHNNNSNRPFVKIVETTFLQVQVPKPFAILLPTTVNYIINKINEIHTSEVL